MLIHRRCEAGGRIGLLVHATARHRGQYTERKVMVCHLVATKRTTNIRRTLRRHSRASEHARTAALVTNENPESVRFNPQSGSGRWAQPDTASGAMAYPGSEVGVSFCASRTMWHDRTLWYERLHHAWFVNACVRDHACADDGSLSLSTRVDTLP